MSEPENQLINVRLEKLQRLRDAGVDPYPHRYDRTHTSRQAVDLLEQAEAEHDGEGEARAETISVGGRIVRYRGMGRATFADIQDGEGKVQLLFRRNNLSESYAMLKELDIGDWIGATGPVFRTRTGEATVEVEDWTVLVEGRPRPAGEVARPDRRGGQVPAALPRPDCKRGKSTYRRHAEQGDQRPAALHGRSRLHGGGDADARAGPRRRDRAPFRHSPQRPRPRPLPANRNGAPPQTARRRWYREGVRGRARLPQRGRGRDAQPGVHYDGELRGVRRLQRRDGDGRAAGIHDGAGGARLATRSSSRGLPSTSRRRGPASTCGKRSSAGAASTSWRQATSSR